jgi:hypothetical protein
MQKLKSRYATIASVVGLSLLPLASFAQGVSTSIDYGSNDLVQVGQAAQGSLLNTWKGVIPYVLALLMLGLGWKKVSGMLKKA